VQQGCPSDGGYSRRDLTEKESKLLGSKLAVERERRRDSNKTLDLPRAESKSILDFYIFSEGRKQINLNPVFLSHFLHFGPSSHVKLTSQSLIPSRLHSTLHLAPTRRPPPASRPRWRRRSPRRTGSGDEDEEERCRIWRPPPTEVRGGPPPLRAAASASSVTNAKSPR
jgi:hypothetical protein